MLVHVRARSGKASDDKIEGGGPVDLLENQLPIDIVGRNDIDAPDGCMREQDLRQ